MAQKKDFRSKASSLRKRGVVSSAQRGLKVGDTIILCHKRKVRKLKVTHASSSS